MSKQAASRSIIASFGALASSLPPESETSTDRDKAASGARPHTRISAGIIGATQRSLAEIREERDRLQELVAKGTSLELNPNQIDPSPFPDRLADDNEVEFESFVKLIREEGQKVPIQVRPHPTTQDRYQVVYGHRRWRAAREIGASVKAIVVELSDAELAIAQGIENSARQDLTWIEKALFASRMEQAAIRRRDIKASLSVDDGEMARFRQVTRAVPLLTIERIGRAPKAGRPRWVALAEAVVRDKDALGRIGETLADDKVGSSDARFKLALGAAAQLTGNRGAREEIELRTIAGDVVGKATFGTEVRLSFKPEEAAFREFLREELPALMARYSARREG